MKTRKYMAVPLMATALAVLPACGNGEGGSAGGEDGGSTATVWMYPVIADEVASQEYWEGVETDFEAANEDFDLEIELLPWENREEKITTAFASGTGPDVVLLTPDMVPQYVQQGSVVPVADIVEGSEVELLPNALEALTVEGELYAVPIYQTITTAIYNKELFEAADVSEVPTTWDEVLAAAPKLAEQGVATLDYPASPNESLNMTFYPLLWQAGGTVFSEDGSRVAFDGPEGQAALEFLLAIQEAGGLAPDVVNSTSTFEGRGMPTSKSAMTYHADVTMSLRIADAIGEDNLVVGAPLEGPEQRATYGIPGPLVLAEDAADNPAARAFLEYMIQPETLSSLAQESGYFPPSAEVEMPEMGPVAQAFAEALPLAGPGPIHPDARQVMEILSANIQGALLGDITAEEALTAAAEEANSLLE